MIIEPLFISDPQIFTPDGLARAEKAWEDLAKVDNPADWLEARFDFEETHNCRDGVGNYVRPMFEVLDECGSDVPHDLSCWVECTNAAFSEPENDPNYDYLVGSWDSDEYIRVCGYGRASIGEPLIPLAPIDTDQRVA